MNADRELLEMAAKAAGIKGEWIRDTAYMQERYYFNVPYDNHNMLTGFRWDPLLDDGEALRLAVRLGIGVRSNGPSHWQEPSTSIANYEIGEFGGRILVRHGDDPGHSTRRAIVHAAAAIGEAMP